MPTIGQLIGQVALNAGVPEIYTQEVAEYIKQSEDAGRYGQCVSPARCESAQHDDRGITVQGFSSAFEEGDVYSSKILEAYVITWHPYYGLKDRRGWLTRYPIEEEFKTALSLEWVEEFIRNGGGFDAKGVYGLYPFANTSLEEHWAQKCDPKLVARVGRLFGRYDYQAWYKTIAKSCFILKNYDIPETIPVKEQRAMFHRVESGLEREAKMIKYGCKNIPSVLTLGWKSEDKYTKMLLERATNGDDMSQGTYCGFNTRDMQAFLKGKEDYKTIYSGWDSYPEDQAPLWRNVNDAPWQVKEVASLGVVEAATKEQVLLLHSSTWEKMHFALAGLVMVASNSSTTSCGDMFTIENTTKPVFTSTRNTPVFPHVRHYADVTFFRYKDKTFVCNPSDVRDHIEADTLKDGLEKWAKRKRKGGLIFSLNDVRNDVTGTAGFCLAGTKKFAKAKMPFLFKLIEEYEYWVDVPDEILSTEFHLKSRSIFDGYAQP